MAEDVLLLENIKKGIFVLYASFDVLSTELRDSAWFFSICIRTQLSTYQ